MRVVTPTDEQFYNVSEDPSLTDPNSVSDVMAMLQSNAKEQC